MKNSKKTFILIEVVLGILVMILAATMILGNTKKIFRKSRWLFRIPMIRSGRLSDTACGWLRRIRELRCLSSVQRA